MVGYLIVAVIVFVFDYVVGCGFVCLVIWLFVCLWWLLVFFGYLLC